MPHKNWQKDNFYAKAKELKGRFDLKAENTLFLSDEEQ